MLKLRYATLLLLMLFPGFVYSQSTITNSLGELVKELVNEVKEAGNYSVLFDASSLSSGMYIYKLRVSEFTEDKKMILLK